LLESDPSFVNGAETDSIGFSYSSIDRARFRDAHLCPVHHAGHIGRVGIAMTYKSPRPTMLINCGLENPTGVYVIATLWNVITSIPAQRRLDAKRTSPACATYSTI